MDKIFTKKNLFLVVPIVIFSACIIVMLALGISNCDNYILDFFQSHRTSFKTKAALVITNMCSVYVLGAIIAIMLIFFKNKKIWLFASINILLGLGINQIIKLAVARQRPISYMIVDESGYSFPSAHSMISMVFYGFLIYVLYIHIKNKVLKNVIAVVFAVLIPCIAMTRIYLGVHYPSDIFAGLLFGYIYLIIYVSIIKKYIQKG